MKNIIERIINKIRSEVREHSNPYLGPFRLRKLKKISKSNETFTIISNNCWAGFVYRYFGLPYNTPTVGLFFYASDYVKFVNNLRYYLSQSLHFINIEQSRYSQDLKDNHGKECLTCPIGKLDDIEIIFMHYHSNEEALDKWNRRKKRINWDNLYIKMSEQNLCSIDDLKSFDDIEYNKKGSSDISSDIISIDKKKTAEEFVFLNNHKQIYKYEQQFSISCVGSLQPPMYQRRIQR